MLYQFSQCQATPWKNGLGSTYQRYILPANADLDNFDVRISMARVQANGPFSLFAGIDRHLLLLDGDGLRLTMAASPAVDLTLSSDSYSFAGEWPIYSELLGNEVFDFNLMLRRGVYQASVIKCQLTPAMLSTLQGDLIVLFLTDTKYQDQTAISHAIAKYDLFVGSSHDISQFTFAEAASVIITQLLK